MHSYLCSITDTDIILLPSCHWTWHILFLLKIMIIIIIKIINDYNNSSVIRCTRSRPSSTNKMVTRARVFAFAKGFYGKRKNCIRVARPAVEKAMLYQYRDRRRLKREMRSLWITRWFETSLETITIRIVFLSYTLQ